MNYADSYAKTFIAYYSQCINDNTFRNTYFPYSEYVEAVKFNLNTIEPMDINLAVKMIEILAFIRDSCNDTI